VKQQLSESIAAAPAGDSERGHGSPPDRGRPRRKARTGGRTASADRPAARECSRLRAKRESLENILSHHSYTTESTKKLLAALENGARRQFRPEGVLADFIEVDPAWERAAEEFLHDELEYVVVKDWTQAEQSMNLLRASWKGGRRSWPA
jgi:chromosome segregation ATPase